MKKRKLKGYVLPTVYVLVIAVLFISVSFLGSALQKELQYQDLSTDALDDDVTPVIKEEENPTDVTTESRIVKPFTSTSVGISKSYYDMTDDEATQANSLVYYEQTYLQNSGVLYSSDEVFDVLATYDGTVTNVSTDEILGNVVEITHNPNLKTVYYSLGEVTVKKDDVVNCGDIIGKSGDNLLEGEKDNSLLVEVYYNGNTIDPEDFYNMNIEDLQ